MISQMQKKILEQLKLKLEEAEQSNLEKSEAAKTVEDKLKKVNLKLKQQKA